MNAPVATATSALPSRVSVVIPTFNRAADLERCLESLVAQTDKDFEVLVCDDGSTDDSGAIAEKFADRLRVSYHWAENFGGPARPRNNGLRLARGRYVALLDSDDWWAPTKLEESVRHLEAGADLVYHELYEIRRAGQKPTRRTRRTRPLSKPVFDDLLLGGNAICNSSVVVRRDLLQQIGGFSEERLMIAWEDYDAWLRLARITDRFVRIPSTLGYYWAGGGNISTSRRLISNLDHFRDVYSEEVRRRNPSGRMPGWYHYLMGRANYQIGSNAAAISHLKSTLSADVPLSIRGKALFTLAGAALRGLLHPDAKSA